MSLHTPVVFIIFNRPQQTGAVFAEIAKAKPTKLLVIADGARHEAEAEQCQQARAVIEKVDWECEVITNFSDENLGCRHRVSSGLNWVFSQVEEAIILEDDCLPAPSFFTFCQTLLKRYRHDERVMMIGGVNFQPAPRTPYSYYFSKYINIWGWASWRRAWQHYDLDMSSWHTHREIVDWVCEDPLEAARMRHIFDVASAGEIDTWDYQWGYTCWSQSGMQIVPCVNMVSNIGFGEGATHTTYTQDPLANLPVHDIWDIQHPPVVVRHREADKYMFDVILGGNKERNHNRLVPRTRRGLGRIKRQVQSLVALSSRR